MKAENQTYEKFTNWLHLHHPDWLFINRILHGSTDGESESFTETYLTPQGQEVGLYINNGIIKEIMTRQTNYNGGN